jgi:hypothetical protein
MSDSIFKIKKKRKQHGTFVLLLLFFCFVGALLPMFYIYLAKNVLSEYYFTVDMIPSYAIRDAHWYTLISLFLFLGLAWRFRPQQLNAEEINGHFKVYKKYKNLLFLSALIALLISISLSMFYGMSSSNLIAQRPPLAIYIGYLSRVLMPSVSAYIGYQIMLNRILTKSGFLIVFLYLTEISMSWSRAGLVSIVFLLLLASSYGIKRVTISIRATAVLSIMGLLGVLVGEYFRSSSVFAIESALMRFYANNSSLYLGMADHDSVFRILTEGQPWVMIDQLFSFVRERTLMPSSFRLLEYWGGVAEVDERGHIAGYAYGWLGLTYGLLKWWGFALIAAIFLIIFKSLKALRSRPSLFNVLLFFYVGNIFLEFFGNLGLDSFVEKLFKGFLSVCLYMIIVYFYTNVVKLKSSNLRR